MGKPHAETFGWIKKSPWADTCSLWNCICALRLRLFQTHCTPVVSGSAVHCLYECMFCERVERGRSCPPHSLAEVSWRANIVGRTRRRLHPYGTRGRGQNWSDGPQSNNQREGKISKALGEERQKQCMQYLEGRKEITNLYKENLISSFLYFKTHFSRILKLTKSECVLNLMASKDRYRILKAYY